jgi:hypothetical protein
MWGDGLLLDFSYREGIMVALWFISVSIVEYVGFLVAVLALFRYPLNYYWPQIFLTSTICSVMSYAMSVDHDIAAAPLIQLAAMIICIWLMFHTPLLWSIIICVSTFVVFTLFQGGVIYMAFYLGLVPPVLSKTGIAIYIIQIFTASVELLLAYFLIKYRIGFLFVPTSRDQPFIWNRTGILLFIGNVISFILLWAIYIIYVRTHFEWFPVLLGIYFIISMTLLYFMRKRNREYVDKPWTR